VDTREQRGLVIAATAKIIQKGSVWLCPSQSGAGKYTVSPDTDQPHCTCPDHEEHGHACKHVYAVRFVIQRELFNDGTEVETRQLTVTETRQTYPQNWASYNRAQTTEKDTFLKLLHELCKSIPESTEVRMGRPRLSARDGIFAACYKVYSQLSSRRFTSDLGDAKAKGYISRVPHFNSVLNTFDNEETYGVLESLVSKSAVPLSAVEETFAVDSTGFSGSRYDRWYDYRYGKAEKKVLRTWVKAHAMIGCLTNVVTSVRVLDNHTADGHQLQTLMHDTATSFTVKEICADKAYLFHDNLNAIAAIGAAPLIPFKKNSSATAPGVWNNAFHFFSLHREEFLSRYHQRSNIESTFSAIKRKFGDAVKSKNDLAMKCEVLAKFVCHNLCCLIHAMEEFGIDPTFGCTQSLVPAQKFTTI
jgi:transposase